LLLVLTAVVVEPASSRIANSISLIHYYFVAAELVSIARGCCRVGRTVSSTSYSALSIHLATRWKAAPLFSRHVPVGHVASLRLLFVLSCLFEIKCVHLNLTEFVFEFDFW
jgi:hypothetical protein